MSQNTKIILALLVGAALMWIYDHRADISFLATNQKKLTGAEKIWAGIQEIGAP